MQCCVPFCLTTPETVSESARITFHKFPSEDCLRDAWLRAIGKQDSHLPDSAVVCSQHFLNDDLCTTESGSRQIRPGAIPSMVQVCMICLDTRSKLLLMSKYNLDEAYQHLVGQPLCDQGNLKGTLCIQCAQRLVNFNKFRDKSLRARALMMELVEKHELISMQHMDIFNEVNNQLKHNIVKTVLDPDHCNLYINSDTDKQPDVTASVESVTIKNEANVPMSVDEDSPQNVAVRHDTEKGFNINLVVTKEEYLSDEEPKQLSDPLFVKPSTSKDPVEEPLAPVKYEITFECSICMEEFADEDTYNYHMSMHMEENQNLTEEPSAEFGHSSSVSPLPWKLETTIASQQEVSTPETVEPFMEEMKNSNIECENSCDILYQNSGIQTQQELVIGETENDTKKSLKCKFSKCGSKTLEKRKKTHTVDKPIACKLCEYKCERTWQLNKHIKTHSSEKALVCQVCGLKCARKNHLSNHMRIHTGEKPFTCKVCGYKFTRKSGLDTHMRTHTGEKPFSCHLCEYKCARKSEIDRHIATHTGKKFYICEVCDFKFVRKSILVNHMKIHTGENPFFCDPSDKETSQNMQLDIHIKTRTSEKTFVCKVCGTKFEQKFDLASHMRTHTGEKLISCDVCDYKSVSKSRLVRHSRTHTGEKPFACDLCGIKFARKYYLVNHMKTHTGEKPFSCEFCAYKCTKNCDLVRHLKTHTGESLFTCDSCDYSSIRNSDLVRHIKTHTSDKNPISCELCGYYFGRVNDLARHMQIIHNGTDSVGN
ncbi:zinc finger protein 2 homolog isoform X1 [Maniola jurtina]|uniref:zinc finger protein 2 homolog isoform X1 n=1 Tax=Maniola jurtina TaxID=191418 RepID=UPI001E688ED6|nr:zinc finger protein 2 homolog isoform X1 [Maniola jurtina]